MENPSAQPEYFGRFKHQLDARKRVTVPVLWRVYGDEQSYYLAWPHPEGCIAVYPPALQKEFLEKARMIAQSDLEGQRFLRDFFGMASKFGLDKQGRILLPDHLIAHAGISKAVVLVGLGNYFQIWSAEKITPRDEAPFDFMASMKRLGF